MADLNAENIKTLEQTRQRLSQLTHSLASLENLLKSGSLPPWYLFLPYFSQLPLEAIPQPWLTTRVGHLSNPTPPSYPKTSTTFQRTTQLTPISSHLSPSSPIPHSPEKHKSRSWARFCGRNWNPKLKTG